MKHFDPFQINYGALGRMVNRKRVEDKLTMRELARVTNVSAATICRAERGNSIDADRFFRLLEYVGTDVRKFIPAELCK